MSSRAGRYEGGKVIPALVVLALVVGGVCNCRDEVTAAREAEVLAVCCYVLVQLNPASGNSYHAMDMWYSYVAVSKHLPDG